MKKQEAQSHALTKLTSIGVEHADNRSIEIAQSGYHQLCKDIYYKLPRELRGMVYIYLIETSRPSRDVLLTDWVGHWSDCDPHRTFYCFPHTCKSGICKAHLMSQTYVGQNVQNELVEHWLRRSNFYFAHNFSGLANLLISNR